MAVFIPILLMGGIVGRLFREFAVTLSVAILVSLLVSLTTTPMMCARLFKRMRRKARRFYQISENFSLHIKIYDSSLRWVLKHEAFTLAVLLITIASNIYLLVIIPKGFFPQQDNGILQGGIHRRPGYFLSAMHSHPPLCIILKSDPAVAITAYTGGFGPVNRGYVNMSLKPLDHGKSIPVR